MKIAVGTKRDEIGGQLPVLVFHDHFVNLEFLIVPEQARAIGAALIRAADDCGRVTLAERIPS